MSSAKNTSVLHKLTLSFGLIFASIAYSISSRGLGVADTEIGGKPTQAQLYKAASDELLSTISQVTSSTSSSTAPPLPPQPSIVATKSTTTGEYADGSYTGSAEDAYYGTVQVKAVIQNGKIANVAFLQYPNTHGNSVFINSQAMPLLNQEAIQTKSAQVDGVSGATFTSDAFAKSLATALIAAKK